MSDKENLDDVIIIDMNDCTVSGVTASRDGYTCYIRNGDQIEEADVEVDESDVAEVWRTMNLEEDEAVETVSDSAEE